VFSFLNPMFLWAAAAAMVPLVLHLMQRRRTVRLQFSTVRFLKMAQKRSSNRIRMENFILWLIRTALMLLLAAAFAMPMLRTSAFGGFLRRAQRDVAIIIDASYSMGYSLGRDTVWDRALDCAAAIIEGLDDGDQVCLFAAYDNVKPVVEQLNGDRFFVSSQVRTLALGKTTSRLCPAVLAAYSSLTQEPRRREREIHIITDGQALAWDGFGSSDTNRPPAPAATNDAGAASATNATGDLEMWQPGKIDKRTVFFVTTLGAPAPENVTPIDAEIQPPLLLADTSPQLRVKLSHTGPNMNTTVKVFIDEKEVGSRAAVLGESGDDLTFAIPPHPPGVHIGKIQTLPDNLAFDNDFHFLLRVREALPTLCVGEPDDAFYVLKALNAGLSADSTMRVKLIGVPELGKEDLLSYACVFLCNGLPLPTQAEALQLEQYVKNGGLLVIFPGDRAGMGDYQIMTSLPGYPSALVEIPPSLRRKMLRWEKPQHPILRTLKLGPGGAPVITVSRRLDWDSFQPGAETLIMMGEREPFMVSRDFGRGRVIMLAVPGDRSWSSFPLSPFFLPLLHQIVQFGAGIMGSQIYMPTTRSLPLSECLPTAQASSLLQDPDRKNVPVRSSIVEGKTVLRADDLLTPGIYWISKTSGGSDMEPAFALNVERSESNLAPIKREDIPKRIGLDRVNVASDKEELMRIIKDFRVGQTLGEVFLWIAFILSIVEVFYANLKARAAPSLVDRLGVEASGKVTAGKAEGGEEAAA